ncbi:MAG TPA: hypothetical protein VKX25_07755 [Bryobacteraceae bacterium]|nr:hypothetical protein [Bryobacteraceae bacterium]
MTGSAWIVNTTGSIQSSGTPVDLVSDLGAAQQQPTFFGRLVFKPGRKHRIVVEGMPFTVDGYNVVNRTIVYRGQTFDVHETVRSAASFNYVFAGYQYDLLSGVMGHLGLSAGGAYVDAGGRITSVETGNTGAKTETLGLPLAGIEGRLFPLPGHRILTVEGGLRGMSVGSYGSYFEAQGSGGVNLGHFALLAGYRSMHPDLHASSGANPSGVDAHLRGPIFSVQWRW